MRVVLVLGAVLALTACGVPESEDVQVSRGAIQGLYFIPFDAEMLESSPAWDAALEEYKREM
ncbi:hypothetical protein BCF46_1143 [Litoreibacter meonggei]|uniref:Uncharacterized protein n=1 Tax=Litoreibacter meonggei TaxID=1049199 RepID=A0A497WQC9_9RHOB|nr:hypothetical protein [Litoreibacter meonggei]RLJ59001.1 hypothetical protein BCF46_1143 [Litoreibacter meonggei]